jgi:hypothetical protein
MTAAAALAAGGIVRAGEVVELAAATGLDLACAATLLAKESGGGRNIWGHDPVPTGGAYTPGGLVTRANYAAYQRARAERRAGLQGCGPTQLTFGAYQAQADAVGGCWDWRCNVTVGFRLLASLIRAHGIQDGFRRYNGSGPAAEAYGRDAAARVSRWRDRLITTPTPSASAASTGSTPPAPTKTKGDPMAPIPIPVRPDRGYRAVCMAEAGAGSCVGGRTWITIGSTWGWTDVVITALSHDGRALAQYRGPGDAPIRVLNNQQYAQELPPGTRIVTLEGAVETPATLPAAALWTLPA